MNDFLEKHNFAGENRHPLIKFARAKLSENEKLYAMVDCSVVPGLWSGFEGYDLSYWNLLADEDADDLKDIAPFLVLLDDDDGANWLIEETLGKNAVTLINSNEQGSRIKAGIRKIINAEFEDGDKYLLRLYNPTILKDIMEILEKTQVKDVFDFVNYYLCESSDPDTYIIYTKKDDEVFAEDIVIG